MEPAESEMRARDLAWLEESMEGAALAIALAQGPAFSLDEAVVLLRETLKG
jgi:hypothetical protein